MDITIDKVYLRKDGRFEVRYPYGTKDDGSINYKSIYGITEEEALNKAKKEIEEKITINDLLIYDKSYLGYDINRWFKNVKIRCKQSTYSNYQYTVSSRIIPKFASMKKKSITSEIVDNYTSELLENGLLPKTVKDILVILQQILTFSNINIKFAMPKVPKKEIQILRKDEQMILEEYLFNNINLTTFGIIFSLYTGVRIGELCALKWENVDLENKKIKINKTITRIKNPDSNSKKKTIIIIDEPKSTSSIREIPIPDFIIPVLEKIKGTSKDEDFILTGNNKYVETRTYFNRYKKILEKLKLQSYNFHALRHTFATRCVENGCDPKLLSEILGHANVKITLERYVHPTYESKVKMMNQLKPMLN